MATGNANLPLNIRAGQRTGMVLPKLLLAAAILATSATPLNATATNASTDANESWLHSHGSMISGALVASAVGKST
jgi:hypothetical protein